MMKDDIANFVVDLTVSTSFHSNHIIIIIVELNVLFSSRECRERESERDRDRERGETCLIPQVSNLSLSLERGNSSYYYCLTKHTHEVCRRDNTDSWSWTWTLWGASTLDILYVTNLRSWYTLFSNLIIISSETKLLDSYQRMRMRSRIRMMTTTTRYCYRCL